MLICCSKNQSFLPQDVETHTSYQHHNFHTIGISALKL